MHHASCNYLSPNFSGTVRPESIVIGVAQRTAPTVLASGSDKRYSRLNAYNSRFLLHQSKRTKFNFGSSICHPVILASRKLPKHHCGGLTSLFPTKRFYCVRLGRPVGRCIRCLTVIRRLTTNRKRKNRIESRKQRDLWGKKK